jgi:hypothetical protein
MKNQINSENNTLQNSLDLQKIEVEKKSWTEPKIEDLDINVGEIPLSDEFARFIGSIPS